MSDVDDLISELKNTKNFGSFIHSSKTNTTPEEEQQPVSEDKISEYIIDKCTKLIQQGVNTITEIRGNVLSGGTPEEVMAYSDLIKAVTSSIDTLNKINLQNKKDKTAKEIKEMEISNSKQLKPGDTVNNTLIIAPREQLMKILKETDKPIDVTPIEKPLE